MKPYPSCRWGHAGIDAAIALRAEHGLKTEEIESVTLGVSRAAMLLIGEPVEKKANPANIVDAQFSGPFVIAMALTAGTMAWDSYGLIGDPAIQSLMQRIGCVNDPEIEAEFPANMSGKLTIRARGRDFVKTVVVPKGEPANFLTEAELRLKFAQLADPVLGATAADALAAKVLRFDRLDFAASVLADDKKLAA